jgi:hypothetical protein
MADVINFVDRALAPKPDLIVHASDLPATAGALRDLLADPGGCSTAACLCASSSPRTVVRRWRDASAPLQPEAPPVNNAVLWHVDKSALPLSEPRRYRDRAHLEFVASQPCLRQPSDPHHLRFMQPRAMGRRVSDEFAVPLCRTHHRAVHRHGDEVAWWKSAGIDVVTIAQRLWQHTRLDGVPIQEHLDPLLGPPTVQAAKDAGPAGPTRP